MVTEPDGVIRGASERLNLGSDAQEGVRRRIFVGRLAVGKAAPRMADDDGSGPGKARGGVPEPGSGRKCRRSTTWKLGVVLVEPSTSFR